ncbi:MAG: leucine-rich repeat domain-containing protein [Clostridia bacterium]
MDFKLECQSVNHTHNYSDTGNNINNTHRVLQCGTCGYKTVYSLYSTNLAGNEITGVNYPLTGSITIPTTINNTTITAIGDSAFEGPSTITSIDFASGSQIATIGDSAFANCTNLIKFTLPIASVTSIGNNAFDNCTSLKSIYIPSSVANIGNNVFDNCTSLESISVSSYNSNYYGKDGILYNKAKTDFIHIPQAIAGSVEIPSGITAINNEAFDYSVGLTSIMFSSSIISIGNSAFRGCSGITSLTIPGSVTSIESFAFCDCTQLNSLTLSSGVGDIGESAFCDCSGITSLIVPGSVSNIGKNAFKNCTSMSNIELQQGVSTIENYAFSNCTNLTVMTIPQSVVSIGSNTFSSCPNLSSLTWNYNPSYSASDLNIRLYLTNVVFNSSITMIGENAFWDCPNIMSVTIPSSVTSIGEHAFCLLDGITQILIPSSVTSISEYAFSACSSIKIFSEASSKPSGWIWNWNADYRPVYYYSTVSKVNCWRYVDGVPTVWLVEGTQGLEYTLLIDETFTVKGISTVNLETLVIPSTYNGLPVTKVGDGSVPLTNSDFLTTVVINNGIVSIEASAFSGCSFLTSLTIPNSLTSIGANAFQNCIKVSIAIPDGVTSIGASAFSGCTGMNAFTIPQSVVSIGVNAFASCKPSLHLVWNYNPALTAATFNSYYYNVNFPVGTSQISANAFANSTWLPIMSIPNTITSVGTNAFANCTSNLSITWNYNSTLTAANFCAYLTKVNFGSGLTTITANAFTNCNKLSSISIPNTVKNIGNNAFSGCTSLQSLSIPNGVTTIGSNAFNGCTGITYFTIPYSVTSVGTSAFAGNANYIVSWNYNPSLTAVNFGSVLQYVYWPSGLTYFSANAFRGCTRFTSFTIPNTVTSIDNSAFYGCTGINKLFIPSGVTSMGAGVFQNCSELTIYSLASSKPSGWNNYWNSSNRPVYWKTTSTTNNVMSGFGYTGSTYSWKGAVEMTIGSGNSYCYNNNDVYAFTGNKILTFNIITESCYNRWTTIKGSINFELRKNGSNNIIRTHYSGVNVTSKCEISIGDAFSINTGSLSNGTYTLTLTSNISRGLYSANYTKTFTFVVDK